MRRFLTTVILLYILPLVGNSQNDDHTRKLLISLDLQLEDIIQEGIDSMAFPGAQLLVLHKGEQIINRAYGYHTYTKHLAVQRDHLYDLASVTKVSSGLPILMQLYGKGQIDLDAPVENIYPILRKTGKGKLTLRNILAHQSGLIPYIVFWQQTLKEDGSYNRKTFKKNPHRRYPVKITENLFQHRKYQSKMYDKIFDSELTQNPNYRYSGLFFLLMPAVIEKLVEDNYVDYLYRNIYEPIGADNLTYNPLEKVSKWKIVPTEYDSMWRNQLVHGTVHDEAAAMLGGQSCNAGLFSNAEDLAKLFQLYINHGSFGDQQIIPESALAEFTSCQFCSEGNRRGLGFDKPLIEYDDAASYVAKSASAASFGHSGFTGTFVWADPEHDLVFVFLSNRVHPSRNSRKLYSMNIRPRLHQLVYDYIAAAESK